MPPSSAVPGQEQTIEILVVLLMHLKVCEMFAFSWVNAVSGSSPCSALLRAEDENVPLGACSCPQLRGKY